MTLILDPNTPDILGTDCISSTDEVWGTPVGEEGPPESRYLFLQVSCWSEDDASEVFPDAEQAFDRRREKHKDERRSEGGEWRNTSTDRLVLGHEI